MGKIAQRLLLLPPLFLLLLLVFILAFSIVLPVSVLHVCISGHRLDVYCISASSTITSFSQHDLLRENQSLSSPTQYKPDEISAMTMNQSCNRKSEIAIDAVKKQVDAIRSAAMPKVIARQNSCRGRHIYVYDLPLKFNVGLLNQCDTLIPWLNLCAYFSNQGMGKPIESFFPHWYQTHQYALEIIFHSRIMNHPCLVPNPEAADLFYIPYYGGLDVLRWHFRHNVSAQKRDELGLELLDWLQEQQWWRKKQGRDHVLVLGKISWDFRRVNEEDPWGNKLLKLPPLETPTKLLIERQPWQINEIAVPHPTFFHPKSDQDIRQWQTHISNSQRPNLISFAGAPRPNMPESIRSILINQCSSRQDLCKFVDCNSGVCIRPESTVKLFLTSEFCLQPTGDSPTRRSVFDSLVAGCIPVLFDPFTAYYQYPWHLPANATSYSVFIPNETVREGKVDIVEVLQKISEEDRKEMRRNIIFNIMPGLVYGDSNSRFNEFQDAFTIAVNNLLWKIGERSVFFKEGNA
ncbi:hypothetical protein SUGI_1107040 [Cryptomeria japonica]|uniref:probable xyloglucan galactosyltransferase GT20 n=1 Tax=Cryptomeria japonica TaxID=3369 RepID=UPI002414873D|nr:probable xyloglucan galactosyltransferase GT20 [Cryptomeria japonica]GLJ52051.1 hypothetical protein SUGI_1107040 [Cryptomeria japonica]